MDYCIGSNRPALMFLGRDRKNGVCPGCRQSKLVRLGFIEAHLTPLVRRLKRRKAA